MTAYAIALIPDLQFGPDIADYLQRIDATLKPYSGAFQVHGTRPEMKEGVFDGDCVVIGFPSIEQARTWYDSPAYAELIALRTRHGRSTVFLLNGQPPGYKAASSLEKLTRSRA
ncbi:DUF1330 domain-containing protein [Diaphorobacter sp. HDW4A]|uniref:DUF1330 domain-containing protein n=1 Tax=Diaphorobacter sp. HDW4A TaxID=2714924 RepID=UPI00140D81CE|nr:DUF1330 domain-containing protein [Diaphorobacter sp. HDW4A]QIL81046.1 DUF1330 domain-containing protein [Diaphorobacter sp. HDW4A]